MEIPKHNLHPFHQDIALRVHHELKRFAAPSVAFSFISILVQGTVATLAGLFAFVTPANTCFRQYGSEGADCHHQKMYNRSLSVYTPVAFAPLSRTTVLTFVDLLCPEQVIVFSLFVHAPEPPAADLIMCPDTAYIYFPVFNRRPSAIFLVRVLDYIIFVMGNIHDCFYFRF